MERCICMHSNFGGTQWHSYFCQLHQQRLLYSKYLIQSICQNCYTGVLLIIFLPFPQCQALCILKQTNLNNVIPGVETDGSLHVVTGSKDRSLRLFKVNLIHFCFSKTCFFYIVVIRTFLWILHYGMHSWSLMLQSPWTPQRKLELTKFFLVIHHQFKVLLLTLPEIW